MDSPADPGLSHSPSIRHAAFDCPHCSAYTQQQWVKLYAKEQPAGEKPISPDRDDLEQLLRETPKEQRIGLTALVEAVLGNEPKFVSDTTPYSSSWVPNMHLSICYICKTPAVWLAGRLLWPDQAQTRSPPVDLPDPLKADYREAVAIAALSPRGAAALLRLLVEKLCVHLGKEGTIDAMIGQLVTDGLPKRVQQALDVVRVVGNQAVHPGTIDFGDDPSTVDTLFAMVDIITEKMISEDRRVADAFAAIPPHIQGWIDDRNRGALGKKAGSDSA